MSSTPPGWDDPIDDATRPVPGTPPAGTPRPADGWTPPPGGWQPSGTWAPAPRPGSIPLRPLDLGSYVEGVIDTVRRSPAVVVGLPAIPVALTTLGTGLSLVAQLRMEAAPAVGSLLMLVASLFFLAGAVGQAITSGTSAVATGQAALGRRTTPREAWAVVRPRVGTLLLYVLLAGLVVGVVAGGLVFVIALVVLSAATAESSLALLFLLPLVLLPLLPVVIYFQARLAPLAASVVLENDPRTGRHRGVTSAIGRAWSLTGGHGWRLAAIFFVLALPAGALSGGSGWMQSVGVLDTAPALIGLSVASALLLAAVAGILGSAISMPAAALAYLDMRMRKEGFDQELRRATGTA